MSAGKTFHRRGPVRTGGMSGFMNMPALGVIGLENKLYGASVVDLAKPERPMTEGAMEARRHMEAATNLLQSQKQESSSMTVSLYTSTASGKTEIVVQTNAQSLDLFIAGLADAVCDAMPKMDEEKRGELIASLFRNAFPVAFAIAGYKAEKVVESRMLICGTAAPEKSSLLAHSRT